MGCAVCIGSGMNADPSFELIVSKLVESRYEIQLRIFCVREIDLILAKRHHARHREHQVGDPAFFQDLNGKLADEWLGRGRSFADYPAARLRPGALLHEGF